MKTAIIILFFALYASSLYAQQYYVRGEIKDESGNILQNVTILQNKTGYIFRSGNSGTFGVIANSQIDTFTFSLAGYHSERIRVDAEKYTNVILKLLPASLTNSRRDKLSSITINLKKEDQKTWFKGEETYASLLENQFVNAEKFPNTGMSLNIDRASYSNIRRFISLNSLVPPDAVRIEEMLNYFNLNYREPKGNANFDVNTTLTSCPWNSDNQLLFINLSAKKLNLDALPASNLVFLIDVSGSMDMPNRLPLLKSAFRLLVNNLREKDSVAIVAYGGLTAVTLNTTSGKEKDSILKAIDELEPGGNTPGESGIKLAYSVARNHFIKNGNNRVVLATDGDFNVGLKTEDELNELITQQRLSGIYLTCLGVGMGNYKDSKIQTLAKKGNGNFSYLDNFQEAEKVLLKEFTQTMYSVADDVFMNVVFNPSLIKEYRIIGFDNKVGALKDSSSIIEGGEIGSGHSMVAIVEIVPTSVNKEKMKTAVAPKTLVDINIKYRLPNSKQQQFFNWSSPFLFTEFDKLPKCQQFSAALAMFGAILRNSSSLKNNSWNELLLLAKTASSPDDPLQKEFLGLIEQAKVLYTKGKKRKG